jgi:hypothetical protein
VRTAQIGALAAAVGAVCVGAGVLADHPAQRQQAAPAVGASPALTSAAKPIPNAATVAGELPGLLPKSGTVSGLRTLHPSDGSTAIAVTYDDGHGVAAVSVVVTPAPASATAPVAGVGAWACPDTTCTVHTQDDGSVLLTDAVIGGDGSSYRQWQATLGRTDGAKIEIVEFNSAQLKGSTATRPEPPLSIAQLAALANALNW